MVAAAIGTLVAPFVSLIVALVMRSSEASAKRRDQLKTWAIVSGVWLAVGAVGFLAAVGAIFGSVSGGTSGDCKGGVDRLVPPEFESSNGEDWVKVRACVDGGSVRVHVKPGHFPDN